MHWYKLAADGGDKRATKRLNSSAAGGAARSALDRRQEMEAFKAESNGKGSKDGCTIM
jgi:hypothetical protein